MDNDMGRWFDVCRHNILFNEHPLQFVLSDKRRLPPRDWYRGTYEELPRTVHTRLTMSSELEPQGSEFIAVGRGSKSTPEHTKITLDKYKKRYFQQVSPDSHETHESSSDEASEHESPKKKKRNGSKEKHKRVKQNTSDLEELQVQIKQLEQQVKAKNIEVDPNVIISSIVQTFMRAQSTKMTPTQSEAAVNHDKTQEKAPKDPKKQQ